MKKVCPDVEATGFIGKSAIGPVTGPFTKNHIRSVTDLFCMTLTRADDAVAIFKSGFTCSQAVCSAFAGDFGIDKETALRLSCGLGGGMAHTGNTCGAVTGAFMVIGMKYGRTELDDIAAKDKTYAVANGFVTEFLRRNHSLNCTDLIGYNLSDPKQLTEAREQKLFHTKCAKFVDDAADILGKIL